MTNNKLQRFGEGLALHTEQMFLNGEQIDIETIDVDLGASLLTSKIAIDNIETIDGKSGQILMVNDYGKAEWVDPSCPDKELREQYPDLEVSWRRVMEALAEYELVKKLVKDYD